MGKAFLHVRGVKEAAVARENQIDVLLREGRALLNALAAELEFAVAKIRAELQHGVGEKPVGVRFGLEKAPAHDVRFRLYVGTEIPAGAELHRFRRRRKSLADEGLGATAMKGRHFVDHFGCDVEMQFHREIAVRPNDGRARFVLLDLPNPNVREDHGLSFVEPVGPEGIVDRVTNEVIEVGEFGLAEAVLHRLLKVKRGLARHEVAHVVLHEQVHNEAFLVRVVEGRGVRRGQRRQERRRTERSQSRVKRSHDEESSLFPKF